MTKIEANIARAGINKFGYMRVTMKNGTSYIATPTSSVIDLLRESPEMIDYKIEFATQREWDEQEYEKLLNRKLILN